MSSDGDARSTDPNVLGLMQGFPPPVDKLVRFSDGGLSGTFPNIRWAFSHQRELKPSANIRRGPKAAGDLPHELRDDIDAVPFTAMDGRAFTWGSSLAENFTDGILVLHKGTVIQERYFGALEGQPHLPHLAMSVTKSFTGLVGAMLAHEGRIDPAALVPAYIPELAGTAFADATVRHVMDMTAGVKYSENYTDKRAEVRYYGVSSGFSPAPPGYEGPNNIFDFLRQLKKEGEHGHAFAYKTCNTEVLAWIIQRVTGKPIYQLWSELLWQKLGMEEDGSILVDRNGSAMCGGGMSLVLRDLARFGEMMRLGGVSGGQQVVPKAVVDDIAGGADRDVFARAGYTTLPGWTYRNQWWVSHDRFGAYTARGIHGQALWIAPKAELVIARFASHPTAANGNGPLDHVSLPAYAALADHLMRG
jgi:CubicO group peptidase (beta-lactamase class C family)